jgi:hypothetical protein
LMRSPRREIETLPYGIWTTDDGEVMFDRRYRPMWHRGQNGEITEMCGDLWIKRNKQTYLYIGRVDRALEKLLLKAEADFINGLEVKTPVRPFDNCFRRKEPEPTIPVKPVLRLVVCNTSARNVKLFRDFGME